MLGWIVERHRPVTMRPTLREVARIYEGPTHHTMGHDERYRRAVLLGHRQELRRQSADDVAIECGCVRGPHAVQNRVQHQGVFGRLSKRLCPLQVEACSIERSL